MQAMLLHARFAPYPARIKEHQYCKESKRDTAPNVYYSLTLYHYGHLKKL
jgi:hypothetical protein